MNWYKIKFASPIQEKQEWGNSWGYSAVGHDGPFLKPIVLYFIDKNFQIHTDDKHSQHLDWIVNNEGYNSGYYSALAIGRYDPNKQVCSLSRDWQEGDMSPQRQEYMLHQIEKILDKTFDNPTIKIF